MFQNLQMNNKKLRILDNLHVIPTNVNVIRQEDSILTHYVHHNVITYMYVCSVSGV